MRAIEKKRPPFMTPKRWILLISASAVTFLVWFGLYLHDIQSPLWGLERSMRQAALQTGELSEVDKLHKHVWEASSWIAEGRDGAGAVRYVYLTGEGEPLYTIDADDVLSEEELLAQFREANRSAAGLEVVRVQPGLFRDSPAWEVYYSSQDGDRRRYYYQFYTFDREGDLIESFTLPTGTGPQ
ncbi:hypothetical protein [Paenibacillus sp. PL2-23]|uniref:hypothetical protein n=1 Tax=Paenibacillus sp. PL2-23 TaxID=2100729 RepID=UPI0030FB9180